MLEFSTLQITLSPSRVSPDSAGGSTNLNRNLPRNVFTPPPTPTRPPPTPTRPPSTPICRAQLSRRTPHEHEQGSSNPIPAAATPPPSPAVPAGYHQYLTTPQPIYPLQPGEQVPRLRTFNPNQAHGFYVVFVGPRLGIFHEYW